MSTVPARNADHLPADPGERRQRTLRACCTVHVLHDGLVDMLYALLPVLAQSLGLSYAQVGMIRAANKVATASLQIPAGLLAERVGALKVLVCGTLIAGLAFSGLAVAESFWPVMLGIFLAGCGNAVQHPLSSTLITGAFVGDGRSRALGIYNTFGDIGKFVFLGVTVRAVGLGVAWQWPVFIFGIVALAVALVTWIMLGAFEVAASAERQRASSVGEHRVPASGWGIKSATGAAALGIIASIDSASRVGFLTFVAFLMIEKGVATGWAATAVLVTLFGGMCGKFACGLLAERFGIVRTIAITEVWTLVGIAAVVYLPSYAAFAVLPVLGIALNGTSSVIYATVGELTDDRRHARAYGLIYTLGSVCGIVSPLLFGLVADGFGISLAMLLMAVSLGATLFLLPMLASALRRLSETAVPGG